MVCQNVPQGMLQKGTEGLDKRTEWGKGNEKESEEQCEECKIRDGALGMGTVV